ncbi:MAG: carbamoyl-phosphate synthase large subunit [Thermoleophilia bacterium]|nr:carbamoyl-phosphate synthase large subunit [Thermoleophilia bacterium]
MPRRPDLETICVIGAGPIVIGQACEFDYSGSQALKVLREEGYRTVVVNSNPATIMTDPGFADRTYLEPLDPDGVAAVLERERPDALLPTLGGQTALNLASALAADGVLDALGVELIGAPLDVIRRAEDRELFRETVESVGLRVPTSRIVTSPDDLRGVSLPAVVRPAFTLGGHGGGFVATEAELRAQVERGLSESPIGQVLVEESVRGWDEFELELMRDRADNVVVVCSIENLDPMGVHTGDSVTVAPQMTLPDEAYQELRDAAAAVIRAVGVETGGSNIQFARQRESGEVCVIEMNPRVSRSSALASKATGYPIAKVAAKLAVGYTLDEIPNDLTRTTPASFEPTLDYVVVKVPRFAFEKFPGSDHALGTQMKSVGEAMGIGRTFSEALLKALRSRELDRGAPTPWATLDDLPEGVHPWFREQIEAARALLAAGGDLLELKRAGWSDAAIAAARGATEAAVRSERHHAGIRPAYRRVDSCAAEVEACSNYLYSTWGEAGAAAPAPRRSVVILGSGPNRIGQGIEFDYCCVHAARTYRELGYETVMVNCNPETVSTDYDTSDRLYFEPLGAEEVLEICEREQPVGVVIQFGGQTPLRLARTLEDAGVPILGTPFEAVDLAEDRQRFGTLCDELGLAVPPWGMASSRAEALAVAERVGYPVLVRPSYVLGGRDMRVCYGPDDLPGDELLHGASILVDRFLEGAVEIDVDALCDGIGVHVAAIMQHVEEAGVHSGDSSCVLPPASLSPAELDSVRAATRRLAPALGVVGLVNVQLALQDGQLYVIEANPRASRTVPFASKAIGANLVEIACRLSAGARLHDLELPPEPAAAAVSVKAAVFPFARFPGADPLLGPEMRSTGEVMASAADFPTAFAKAERAAGRPLPAGGAAFVSVRDEDKSAATELARRLATLGFRLIATPGTARALAAAGLAVEAVRKVGEEGDGPSVVDRIRRGRCDLVINTPQGGGARADGYQIREAALVARIPCITTLAVADAAVEAIARAGEEGALSLQERVEARTA